MSEAILIPHDLTEFSARAFDALDGLRLQNPTLHVLHVLPRIDLSFPGVVWSADEDEPRRKYTHEQLETQMREAGLRNVVVHVRIGDAGTRIVDLAKELQARWIVMSSHGRTGMNRMLMGSVAEYVARFAPCPVVILPPVFDPISRQPVPSKRSVEAEMEHVEHICVQLTQRVAARGDYLTAARIGLPPGGDPGWWQNALSEALTSSGIDFVDLSFSFGPWEQAILLSSRFEEG